MGCCETREKVSRENIHLAFTDDTPSLVCDIKNYCIPNLNEVKCERTLKIYDYVENNESSLNWVSAIDEENFTADKCHGSCFKDKTLVTKLHLKMGSYVPLNMILDLFLIPDQRLKWDTCLKSIEILDGSKYDFTEHFKVKVLFFSGDVLETVKVFHSNDAVYIISFSVENEKFPETKDMARMHKLFGCVKITEKGDSTHLTVMNQLDTKSKMESMISSVGIVQQKIWIESFQKRVQRMMMNSRQHKFIN
jgi:hypothetical protein